LQTKLIKQEISGGAADSNAKLLISDKDIDDFKVSYVLSYPLEQRSKHPRDRRKATENL
jgi:hypothetical protein